VTNFALLNDIALATLTAAKLVLKSASAAGLDLNRSPEVLASIEEMSDQTARQHLEQIAATLLGASGGGSDLLRLKMKQRHWPWIAEGSASDRDESLAALPGRAAHVLGEIMLFLGRSRAEVEGDSVREADEDLAQVLAMMALAKVLFCLIEGEAGTATVEAGGGTLGDSR
jgi:hypothetical protein